MSTLPRHIQLSARYILMKSIFWIVAATIMIAIVVFTEAEEALFSRQLHR